MRDPKKRALSNACHWLNRCYDFGFTAEEIIAQSTASHAASHAVNRKEKNEGEVKKPLKNKGIVAKGAASHAENYKEKNEGGEKNPPHPLKERGKKKEKTPSPSPARARVRGSKKKKGKKSPGKFPPTFEQVDKFATIIGATPAFAKSWYDRMNDIYNWRHPKTGKRIRNWMAYLNLWWVKREDFDPLPEPKKEPKTIQLKNFKMEDIA